MINLGQNWGVKDSGLLAYKQVGSKYFNKDFDFTRASSGTYIDKNGVLQTAEVYNLVDYSQIFLSNSAYYFGPLGSSITSENNLAPNGTFTASEMLSTGQGKIQTQYKPLPANTTYTLSVFVKNVNAANYQTRILADGGTGGSNITSVDRISEINTETWTRVTHTFTTNTTAQNYIFYISNGVLTDKSIQFWGAQLVEGTEARDYQYTNGLQGLPRISYENGVGHLLLEPQRSNLLLQSNSFDTSWAPIGGSVTSGQSGIYGTNDAWLLTKSATNGRVYQSVSYSGTNTASIYAKAADSNWLRIYLDTIGVSVYFDLENGVVGGTAGAALDSTNIESVGNGWYRCSATITGSGTTMRIYPSDANNTSSGTSGSIYIQHSQLESGSYPTSIIETTTSQVTRTADVANNCGTEQDFNSEEGVLYAEVAALANDGTFRVMSINDGTTGNVVQMFFSSVDNRITAETKISNVGQGAINYTLTNNLLNNKIAFKYKENDFALWVNGVEVGTDTSGSVLSPNTLNNFDFALVGSLPFYGKVRSVKYFPTALTDEELENLTT